MTLSTRNMILRIGLTVSVLLALGASAAAAWLGLNVDPARLREITVDTGLPWLGLRTSGTENPMIWVGAKYLVLAWFAIISLVVVMRYFRRTTAPEMFFFAVFLLTLPIETLRYLHLLREVFQLPLNVALLATRGAYFAHALGIFSLFISSLYALGGDYQRTGTVLSIAALLAFAFAYALPVDPTTLHPNLVNPIGNLRTVQVVALVLNVLVLANFVYARFAQEDRGYFVLAAAVAGITIGNELGFYAVGPLWGAIGAGLIMAGVMVFWRQLHAMYLWIS